MRGRIRSRTDRCTGRRTVAAPVMPSISRPGNRSRSVRCTHVDVFDRRADEMLDELAGLGAGFEHQRRCRPVCCEPEEHGVDLLGLEWPGELQLREHPTRAGIGGPA